MKTMKTILTLAVIATFAGNILAGDPMQTIKQKAKNIANENNARQDLPPAYPSAPKPATAAPAAPTLTPQQQAFARVQTDLGAIKAEPTAEQKSQLASNLQGLAQGANKPTPATSQKLANDLSAALAGKTLLPAQRSRMATDVQAVFNCATTPQSQLDDIIGDVPSILKKAGVGADAMKAVNDDLKAVAAEIKKKPAK